MSELSLDMTENIRSANRGVIPSYQDAKPIGDIARRTRTPGSRSRCDDGSTDQTEQRARKPASSIVHTQNPRQGEAIKTGLRTGLGLQIRRAADQDRQITWVVLLDSDGQHLPEEIDRFLLAAGW